jgi:hypothetical protein
MLNLIYRSLFFVFFIAIIAICILHYSNKSYSQLIFKEFFMHLVNHFNGLPDVILIEVFSYFSASDLMGVSEPGSKTYDDKFEELTVLSAIRRNDDRKQLALVSKFFNNSINYMKKIDVQKGIQLRFFRDRFIQETERDNLDFFCKYLSSLSQYKDSIPAWIYRTRFHKDLYLVAEQVDSVLTFSNLTLDEKKKKYLSETFPINLEPKEENQQVQVRPTCAEIRQIFSLTLPIRPRLTELPEILSRDRILVRNRYCCIL